MSMECPHLVIGEGGRCENCFEFIGNRNDPFPQRPEPKLEPHPDVFVEAKMLDAEWNKMLERIDARILRRYGS